MGRLITKSDGTVYCPTNLEIRRDLKMLAKENQINMTATLNRAIHTELVNRGLLHE